MPSSRWSRAIFSSGGRRISTIRAASGGHSDEERRLLAKYRDLPLSGRQTVHTLVDALTEMTDDLRAAVPAADHQDIFHTWMNCHRHMNDHLIINKLIFF